MYNSDGIVKQYMSILKDIQNVNFDKSNITNRIDSLIDEVWDYYLHVIKFILYIQKFLTMRNYIIIYYIYALIYNMIVYQ